MKIKTLVTLLLVSATSFSQKFSTHAGLGIGGNVEKKFPECVKKDKGRIAGFIKLFYHAAKNYAIGIELITSGRSGTFLGGMPVCDAYNAMTNTRVLNFNNLEATSYLVRNRYTFTTSKKLKPYLDIGIGTVGYFSNTPDPKKSRAKQYSFAVSPELGCHLSKLQFACKVILGGKTPDFSGFDSNHNENISLSKIKPQQLYVTMAYRLFEF